MNYITLDIEGDGLNRSINQVLFPEGNHFDKNTTIWCATFASPKKSLTFFKKLPNYANRRCVRLDNGRFWGRVRSYHDDESMPYDWSNETIFRDYSEQSYKDYLLAIHDLLDKCNYYNYKVFIKSYKEYDYDKDLLKVNFDKYDIDTYCLDVIKGISIDMDKTHAQWQQRQ